MEFSLTHIAHNYESKCLNTFSYPDGDYNYIKE